MNPLQQLLQTEDHILLDGAMGTILMGRGLEQGAPPESWNLIHPEQIQAVHQEYIEAGSRLILANAFGGSRQRLKLHKLDTQVVEINRAAGKIARAAAEAAPHKVIIGASIGPTGELFEPMGELTFEDAKSAFAEQAIGLSEGGVEIFWIETMSDLQEVKAAIAGIRSVCDLPIAATMTFDTNGHTMMGVSPLKALEELLALDLAAIGANCGNGPAEIEAVIKAMHEKSPETILVAKSNAGIPQLIKGELSYDGTPEIMALYAKRVRKLGARLIGGCCGNHPEHMRAMADALSGTAVISTTTTAIYDGLVTTNGNGNGNGRSTPKPARERKFRRKRN